MGWSTWIIGLRQDCLRRLRLAQAMNESGSSSWPTASVTNAQGNGYTRDNGEKGSERLTLSGAALASARPTPRAGDGDKWSAGKQREDSLTQIARQWPTPDAALMNDGESPENWVARQARQKAKGINGNGMGMPLGLASRIWQTPSAADVDGGGMTRSGTRNDELLLNGQAQTWATPQARLADNRSPQAKRYGDPKRHGGHNLDDQVAAIWPTPAERDWRAPNSQDSQDSQDRRNADSARGQQLPNFVEHSHFSPPDQATPAGQSSSPSIRRLNPRFVEWLMGWPIGWTDCGSAVMEFPLWLQRMRSELSRLLSVSPMERDGQMMMFPEIVAAPKRRAEPAGG